MQSVSSVSFFRLRLFFLFFIFLFLSLLLLLFLLLLLLLLVSIGSRYPLDTLSKAYRAMRALSLASFSSRAALSRPIRS